MPYFDAPDAAIYYEVTGDGPPLVLLHGYALNHVMWNLQKPVFAKTHKVIAVDLRGFGDSSCGQRWSGSVMAEDVAGLIKSLNLANVTIVGLSMSGPVAVRLALEMPEIVTRLILASSILPSAGRPKARSESEIQQRELDLLKLRGPKAWAEAMGLCDGPLVGNMFKRNPDIVPLWEKMLSRHRADFLLCMLESRLNTESPVNWRARLPEIAQPTLVVTGAQDARFIDAARHLAEAIPNARLEIISGAGHMVNLEEVEKFNGIVMDFLSVASGPRT
jgi:pimeloyl-ACP methyl ester carboxylesterase